MYLVDFGFGKETLFRSSRELTAAIRRGDIGEQCRIYHRARATWLPITVHPEFRRLAGERPARPSLASRRRQWTFMPAEETDPLAVSEPTGPTAPAVMPPAARSWRQSLGSAFRFWGKGQH